MKKLKQHSITKILFSLFLLLFICNCSNEGILSENEEVLLEKESSNLKKGINSWEDEIVRLQKKMRRFHNFKVAIAQGYDTDVTGYVPQMGHHYLKGSLVDEKFELEKPEVLQYVPDDNGVMQFVAVEYLAAGSEAPEGFTGDSDDWHFNEDIGLWTLHVWVGLYNPDGIFAPFNPDLPN